MTPLLASSLVLHIVLGLVALALIHFTFMQIIRREPPYARLVHASLAAVALFLLSWASGAYYYVVHYGSAVKPRILAGAYPWAHQVMMEAKEHVFLLIPFLAIAVWFAMLALRSASDTNLKVAAAAVAAAALGLGVFVAGPGTIDSCSVS